MKFEEIWKLVEAYGEASVAFGDYMGKMELDACYKTEKALREALKKLCEGD